MTQEIISPELTGKLGSLRAVSLCHKLLSEAGFPITKASQVQNALSFLEALHSQLVDECIKDPQAKDVPELQQFMKEAE